MKGSSLTLTSNLVELSGGTSKYPWAVEDGLITAEMSLKFMQYEDFLIQLFLGTAPTDNSADALANVSALTNKKGTSVMSATTGLASIAVKTGSEADVKFGKFVVKAVSATTVDVYMSSDLDIGRGNKGTIQNDAMKITATPLTITASAPTDVPNFGLTLNGGSGAIALVAGDTATFETRPENTGSMQVDIGSTVNTSFAEFGAVVMAAKRGNGELFEIDCVRCKAAGMPINFDQNVFSEADVKIKCLYDSVLDKVFSLRSVSALS